MVVKKFRGREPKIHFGVDLETSEQVFQPLSERLRNMAVFGQTGSGKSEGNNYQVEQIMLLGLGLLSMDSHRVSVTDQLDRAIRHGPGVTNRLLFLSSAYPEKIPEINLMERHATTPVQQYAEREAFGKELSQILIRVASGGGRDATEGMVRYLNNCDMAAKAIWDANLPPFPYLPHLFLGPSETLDAILARTKDPLVIQHFRKLVSMNVNEREKYTHSIVDRIHGINSTLLLRALLSGNEGISPSWLLANDYIVLVDSGRADGNTPETARVLESALWSSYSRAAQRRDAEEATAHPCYIMIEEAARIISEAEVEYLAEARKFGAPFSPLIFQGTEALQRGERDLLSGVLTNCGTLMIFRMGDDEQALRFARLLYADQVDPRRVMAYRERTSQRVIGYREIQTTSRNTSESHRRDDYTSGTVVSGYTYGTQFRPEYGEFVERDPVFMNTGDQFLERAGDALNLLPGEFLLRTPSCRRPRLCYSPMLRDPYRCMPGIREKRRNEFLKQLFARWPYRDTEGLLCGFDEMSRRLSMPAPDDPPTSEASEDDETLFR